MQAEAVEVPKDLIGSAWTLARWIQVFDAHQPAPAVGACVHVARDGRDQ